MKRLPASVIHAPCRNDASRRYVRHTAGQLLAAIFGLHTVHGIAIQRDPKRWRTFNQFHRFGLHTIGRYEAKR